MKARKPNFGGLRRKSRRAARRGRPVREARPFDARTAAVAVLVTLAAWQILSRAAANVATANEDYRTALALRSSDSGALTHLASEIVNKGLTNSEAGDRNQAVAANAVEVLTRRALVQSPFEPTALRLMAQAAETMHDEIRADALMRMAGSQTIRDPVVDIYLLVQDDAHGHYAPALMRADALLRVDPGIGPTVFPVLDAMALKPDAHPSLLAVLDAGPPWRGEFLASLASRIADPTYVLDLLLALKTASSPLRDGELGGFLDELIKRNMVDQAYYVWLQFLPADRIESLPYLYDGSFRYDISNLPFDWSITQMDGAVVSVEKLVDQPGDALRIEFDGRRVPFRNVTQTLVLPPGKYRLSGLYMASALSNPRGMTWRLYCLGEPKAIAETDRVSGTSKGWQRFETGFDVPATKCGAQLLRLELAARASVEEAASGRIAYTDLKIDKMPVDTDRGAVPTTEQPGGGSLRAPPSPR